MGGWVGKKGGEEGEGLAADGNPEPPFLTQTRRGGKGLAADGNPEPPFLTQTGQRSGELTANSG